MFNKFFKKNEPNKIGPTEPIYPGESFGVGELNDENGFLGIVNVNNSYQNYPNKKYFPWFIQVTLELQDYDDRKMPNPEESKILEELEELIEKFIQVKHKTHYIGRVTKEGLRDLLFYVDLPRFDQEEASMFFDKIQEVRRLNFFMEQDPTWKNVAALIK